MIGQTDLHRFVYETGSPFKRLEALLADTRPNSNLEPLTLTVGEPRHAPPAGLEACIARAQQGFTKYPAINGTAEHRQALAAWITRRYDLQAQTIDPGKHVLPLNGSREGLVLGGRCARDRMTKRLPNGTRPIVLMQNPFYQSYAVGALMADCDVVLLQDDDHLGDQLSDDIWQRTIAAYIASPTNPQGQVLSHADWHAWIDRARLHDFYLLADECYSEIYRTTPPPGVLEVAASSAGSLRKVVSFNSLSKRSNLPGLRTGFAAGDEDFMAVFMKLRNMGGPQVPLPLQAAATHAWSDETHVEASRALYAQKWALVESILGPDLAEPTPQAGFFLWLKLPPDLNDVQAATKLWQEQSLRTVPGSFLAYPDPDATIGSDRLRIALVDDVTKTTEALSRLSTLFHTNTQSKAAQNRP